jgi:tRNA (cmo5U34)-methyltransferase
VRTEQLDLLLSLIAEHYVPGSTILDRGSGSGLVEEQLFRRLPEALVAGMDYSPAMMAMAEKRLAGEGQQLSQ